MINAAPSFPLPTPPPPPNTFSGVGMTPPAAGTSSLREAPSIAAPAGGNMGNAGQQKNKFALPKKIDPRLLIGAFVAVVLIVGGGIGLYVSQQNQETRQQASGGNACDSAFASCIDSCSQQANPTTDATNYQNCTNACRRTQSACSQSPSCSSSCVQGCGDPSKSGYGACLASCGCSTSGSNGTIVVATPQPITYNSCVNNCGDPSKSGYGQCVAACQSSSSSGTGGGNGGSSGGSNGGSSSSGGGACISQWCTTASDCSAHGGTTGSFPGGSCSAGLVACCPAGSSGGGSSGGGGNTNSSAPSLSTCGQRCNSASDCAISAAGGGFQPICYQGKCANPLCPSNTTPGSICACGPAPTGIACGDFCGANGRQLFPINCQNGGACGNSSNGGTTGNRCLPRPAPSGYVSGGGICKGDHNPNVYCINHTDGTAVTTVADLQAACAAANKVAVVCNSPCNSTTAICPSGLQCLDTGGGNMLCRNSQYPTSTTCAAPAAAAAQPTPTPITYACNSSCTSDSQCQGVNLNYVCYFNTCRLSTNVTSTTCASPIAQAATSQTTNVQKSNAPVPVTGDTSPTIALTGAGMLSLIGGAILLRKKRSLA